MDVIRGMTKYESESLNRLEYLVTSDFKNADMVVGSGLAYYYVTQDVDYVSKLRASILALSKACEVDASNTLNNEKASIAELLQRERALLFIYCKEKLLKDFKLCRDNLLLLLKSSDLKLFFEYLNIVENKILNIKIVTQYQSIGGAEKIAELLNIATTSIKNKKWYFVLSDNEKEDAIKKLKEDIVKLSDMWDNQIKDLEDALSAEKCKREEAEKESRELKEQLQKATPNNGEII